MQHFVPELLDDESEQQGMQHRAEIETGGKAGRLRNADSVEG
jgi:hypothetical protein